MVKVEAQKMRENKLKKQLKYSKYFL